MNLRSNYWKHAGWVLKNNLVTAVALICVLIFIALAILAPYLPIPDPIATNVQDALQPPSWNRWFGTDQLGRDIASRLIFATRLDLTIAFFAVVISAVIGSLLGSISGYSGGGVDRAIGRITEIIMAFPLFVMAIAMVAALGNRIENVIIATAVINLPYYIRLSRAEVSVRRDAGWVEAARLAGEGSGAIVFKFLLPNILPALAVQVSLNLGWSILNAAGLSFLGLGVTAPTPEWGIMVAEGARFITAGKWWLVVFPGLTLMLAVLCFNLLGDGLRDILDPRTRT